MKGEDCAACDEGARLQRDGESKEAKALRPKKRFAVWVIDRKDEDEGLQFWPMPFTVHRDACLSAEDDESGEILELDHPNKGFDIIFKKEGSQKRTEYVGTKLSRKESSISEDEDEQQKILEYLEEHPVPDQLKFYDSEHIAGVFSGSTSSEEEEDDEKPRKKKKKSKR